jgi:molybdopterin molybdotransferase
VSEPHRLISVDEALQVVLASVQPLSSERVPILDTLGRVLAEDIAAETDIPPLSNSAMDGYAVRAVDTARADPQAPVRLTVIYDLAAVPPICK